MPGATEGAKHWADLSERGSDWGPALMAFVYRTLGRGACWVVLTPVIVFFYLSGARQRRASLDYLRRVWRAQGRADRPGHWEGLRHFFSFGESLLDKYAAWTGQVARGDVEAIDGGCFDEMRDDPRGAILISAHFGAIEIVRAIASREQKRRVNVVMHTKNARRFNDMIQRYAPKSRVAIIEVTEFDVSTAVELSAAVGRGEWVVIMGDRMPISRNGRTVPVTFLGATAHFPQGPFVLAAALRCPTYVLFCYKAAGRHQVAMSLLTNSAHMERRDRMAKLSALIESYARTLENLVKAAPYQWFNFFDFWARRVADGAGGGDERRDHDH